MIDEEYIVNTLVPHIEEKIKKENNDVYKVILSLTARIETLENDRNILIKKLESIEARI